MSSTNDTVEAVVRRVASGFVHRNPHLERDVDDLRQEGRIAVWRQGQESAPPSHVGNTARNGMIDWLRSTYGRIGRQKKTVAWWLSLDEPQAFSEDNSEVLTRASFLSAADDPAVEAVTRIDGLRALEKLSERDRSVVWTHGMGVPLRVVGEAHGVTESRACQIVSEFRSRAA